MYLATNTQSAKDLLKEIEARHETLAALEQSISELAQLFTDLAVMIEQQGSLVDQIDSYTANAADSAARGKGELQKAVVYQKSAWAKKWWICGCCTILVIIIGLLVYIFAIKPAISAVD